MTEAKHTPGPWRVDGQGRLALVRGADETIVAKRHMLPGRTHEANAHLIAAAPDMLDFIRDLEADYLIQGLRERAQKIIAKVEGRG